MQKHSYTKIYPVKLQRSCTYFTGAFFFLAAFLLLPFSCQAAQTVFFSENFEDTNFTARGWYDETYSSSAITAAQYHSGTHAYECHFTSGSAHCAGGDPRRKLFTASDSVYVSYWTKMSSNWVGSGLAYHPHEFLILTNKNDIWSGLAFTHLTGYIEQLGNKPAILIQDGENIDQTRIGTDLTNITENRSVAGCNGANPDGYTDLECYDSGGGVYWNGKQWLDSVHTMSLNTWHHVETYFQMNTIQAGKGIGNGKLQYWLDNQLIIDKSNVLLRTNQNADMQWNQFVMAFYIGDGSPVDQYVWVDDLVVADSRAGAADTTPPAAPAGLSVT
jgi:hypothetical protein